MPTQPETDALWMQRALALARRGIALTAPNPIVGCVLLDASGQLAGEGWHQYDLLAHAEVAALRDAAKKSISVRGGTAYVTLEPCSHTGRTPPCTQALIDSGIRRVVAATIDPNPAVSGRGLQALRDAGIETEAGICQPEARRLNEPFARWIQHHRPLVVMKVAMTLDGRIAPPPGEHTPRQPYWITSEPARAAVQTLRWQADAVLVGIDTVLADDPMLTDRSGLPRRRPLQRLVLDSALRMPLDSKLVSTAHDDVIVITVSQDQARIRQLTDRGVRVEVLPAESEIPAEKSSSIPRPTAIPAEKASSAASTIAAQAENSSSAASTTAVQAERTPWPGWKAGRVPLDSLLDKLGEEGILTLLTETGTRLNTALLAGGLVDRIHLFVAPQIMGSDAVPAFRGLAQPIHMAQLEVERYGNDLALCTLLRDPWPQAQ
jgi:diaminohydroxyphosphoribosylaminopyrimidine deaminase/5-amino-6-(5-phosphoribosylamino)uracil reductase